MKRLLFLALMLPIFAMAQIGDVQVGKKKTPIGKIAQAEFYYTVSDGDTVNTILFRNAKYSSLVDYESAVFIGGSSDRQKLKEMFLSCFKEENVKNKDFDLTFKLGDDRILLFISHSDLVVYVGEAYFRMNEKQVHKLFGDE